MSRRELGLAVGAALLLVLPGLWTFTLIDPWEGHYAEVGRRILVDGDWIQLRWRDEVFRSKPALAPWLIAGSLRAHGFTGSYGGELMTPLALWAVRVPFALCAAAGLVAVWAMLRRLVSRRAAWLGLAVLGTVPFYALVARQAITDMPMVAATAGALACFALALHDGDRPLARWRWRLTGHHGFLGGLACVVGAQVVYGGSYFAAGAPLGRGVAVAHPVLWMTLPFALGWLAIAALTTWVWPVRARRDVYLLVAYALLGVSVVAKGPPGAALAVVVVVLYVATTRQWRLVLHLRVIEGALVALLVAAPWHVAMILRDGQPFVTEYFGHHWLKRAGDGVHQVNAAGDGTLSYFVHQLGIGLWPVVAVLPAAGLAALRRQPATPADHVRLLGLLWSAGGLVLFTCLPTKYHHYILPAVPGFAVLVAVWLDDALAGRARAAPLMLALGAAIAALVTCDVAAQPERLVELFIYRYDRPWPAGPPWSLELAPELWALGAAFVGSALGLTVPRVRRHAARAVIAASLVFSVWAAHRYMVAIGPHWGQGQLHASYYRLRDVHGARLHYDRPAELLADWPGARTLTLRTFVPDSLTPGAPATLTLQTADQRAVVHGRVTALGRDRVDVHVPADEVARVHAAIGPDARPARRRGPAWVEIDADRLIAWNLYWRSELFWSSGELWGRAPDTRTDFGYRADAGFRAYLARPESQGRRFFVLTEAGNVDRLRALVRELAIVDRSSNKYTLVEIRP